MDISRQLSRPQRPATDRIAQVGRSALDVVVLLVSAVAVGSLLVGALVWILGTLDLVLV